MANELVPFGKYKGQPLEVLLGDTQYMSWLSEQPWVKERFPTVQTLIINNFGEPNDTPEHNEMQNSFFNQEYLQEFVQRKIVRVLANKIPELIDRTITRYELEKARCDGVVSAAEGVNVPDGFCLILQDDVQITMQASEVLDTSTSKTKDIDEIKKHINSIDIYVDRLLDLKDSISKNKLPRVWCRVVSEVDGWDIRISPSTREYSKGSWSWECCSGGEYYYEHSGEQKMLDNILHHTKHPDRFLVEIKPDVGDDFPSILRQMKTNRKRYMATGKYVDPAWCFLVYRRFQSSSTTEEDVKNQFLSSGFIMVKESEFWPPEAEGGDQQ